MADKYIVTHTDMVSVANELRAKSGKSDPLIFPNEWKEAIRGIVGGLDTAITEYTIMNDKVTEYLAAADAAYTNDNSATVSVMANYQTEQGNKDRPLGISVASASDSKIYIQSEEYGDGWMQSSNSTSFTIYNSVPNKVFQYLVKADDGSLVSDGKIKPTGKVRMLYFQFDARNSRDIGGWTCDGGTVNYGKLFRGAVVNNDSYMDANAAIAKHIGLKHQIDFRGDSESNYKTESHFGSSVRYQRITLSNYYKDIIDIAGSDYENVKAVFRAIFDAVAHNEPLYYNCSLGRDRTGTVTFMLLALLGVPRREIDMDYELSSFSSLGAWESVQYPAPRTRTDYNALATYLSTLGGSTLRDNAVWWFIKAGFTIDELNEFRSSMIDGTPDELAADNYAKRYTISQTLTNCASDLTVTSVLEKESLTVTLTPDTKYSIDTIIVTMGGTDISSSVVNGYIINIPIVTGDIVITATASKALVPPPTSTEWTNRVFEATTEVGGTEIYNTYGYSDGKYISSDNTYGSADGITATGYIAYDMTAYQAQVIYVKGISLDYSVNSRCRIYFERSSGTLSINFLQGIDSQKQYFVIETLNADTLYYKITPVFTDSGRVAAYDMYGDLLAFRISGVGIGENLIVTLDEPIE